MRAILSALPTSDAAFVYPIFGGQIDRASAWVAVIGHDGRVTYKRVGDQ